MPPLMRAFARVDKEGKVAIPSNIAREVGFKPGQMVEVKTLSKKSVAISARDNAR